MTSKRPLRQRANKTFDKKPDEARKDYIHFVPDAALPRALHPPVDNFQVEHLHGVPVSDPFRPMEDFKAPETTAWVERQNEKFRQFIKPAEGALQDALNYLEAAMPRGMRETMPSKCGKKYLSWRMNEGDTRWVLYIKNTANYGAPAKELLNPLKIDPTGKTNIVGIYPSPDHKTIGYRLSVSGSDESTLLFMDIATRRQTGPVYENFRSGITWDRDSKGFHYHRPAAARDKTMEACHHTLGTDPKDDTVVYSPDAAQTRATYFRTNKGAHSRGAKETWHGKYEWLYISNTEPDKNALLVREYGQTGDFREVFPHRDGTLSPVREIGGRIYALSSHGAPNGRLVAFDIDDAAPEKWNDILPEDPKNKLKDVDVWQNKIFATYADDIGEVLKVYDLKGNYLHDVPIPKLSTFSTGAMRMKEKTCLISYSNFQENGNVYQYDSRDNSLTLHKESTTPVNLKDCIVERLHATSKDGTQIPMTVIRAPDTQLDGTAATLLYGYGGFNVSLEPAFSRSIAQWVRAGGIYVQANLRGGGEYGKKWHDAGRQENKQNVFDDFIACAEHLVGRQYTAPARLAIQGGSNGGLLTAACVLQRPDLFGAVVSEVPVTDMFRFHIGSYYGYGWKSDYGDPDVKKDFNVAAKYSPLHNVPKGFKHPPILIRTDMHDDRVLPWHAFKMAATLQVKEDASSLTLMETRTDGGHSAGMTEKQWNHDIATVRAFLHRTLGPTDQRAYKAQLANEKRKKRKNKPKTPE